LVDDGDQIVLHDDQPDGWQRNGGVCLMIHGLAGCRLSGYMRRIGAKLNDRGVRVFRMDMRGCGAGEGLARFSTHCGRWADAAAAVEFIAREVPGSPLALVGFSLGGTIALNLAAELGGARLGNLVAVMAVCPPVDLHAVRRRFDTPTGRPYDRHFVRLLWQKTVRRMGQSADFARIHVARPPRRLREYDEWITAPLAGYASADDYYTRTSPGPRFGEIRLPTTIVAAADDPVVPLEPLLDLPRYEPIDVVVTRHGGHLGYIGARNGDADNRWMDWRVVEWGEPVLDSSRNGSA
jgi:hypothetical protein